MRKKPKSRAKSQINLDKIVGGAGGFSVVDTSRFSSKELPESWAPEKSLSGPESVLHPDFEHSQIEDQRTKPSLLPNMPPLKILAPKLAKDYLTIAKSLQSQVSASRAKIRDDQDKISQIDRHFIGYDQALSSVYSAHNKLAQKIDSLRPGRRSWYDFFGRASDSYERWSLKRQQSNLGQQADLLLEQQKKIVSARSRQSASLKSSQTEFEKAFSNYKDALHGARDALAHVTKDSAGKSA